MRLVGGLACLLLLMGLLTACGRYDYGQADLCRLALPALEPDGLLTVTSIRPDSRLPHVIRIDYGTADGRKGALGCAFGGGAFEENRMKLVGLELDGTEIGQARLFFLQRFWLGKPEALTEATKRLAGVASFDPLVSYPISRPAGYFLQQVVNALPLGAFYALIAVSYALVYGLIGRINLAFGDMAMSGAYVAVAATASGAAVAGGLPSGGVAILALLALLVAGLHGVTLGLTAGAGFFEPLGRARPVAFLIGSVGLGLVVTELTRLLAGGRVRWTQSVFDEPVALIGGGFEVTVTLMRLFEVAGAMLVVLAVIVLMRKSAFGRSWRALADDAGMAGLLGIDGRSVTLATFALSAALASLAGGLTALHYGEASAGGGIVLGLKALTAAVVGGLGSLPGAAIGGLAVGLTEALWTAYLPNAGRETAVFAALILTLMLRPQGLFGRQPADAARQRF